MFKILGKLCVKCYCCLVSPLLPHACKFRPTCSKYMIESIDNFGFLVGFFMGIKRIFRCNPKAESRKDLPNENLKGDYKWLL